MSVKIHWVFDHSAIDGMNNVGDHTAAVFYDWSEAFSRSRYREDADKLIDKDLAQLGLKPISFKDYGDVIFKDWAMMLDNCTEDAFMKEYRLNQTMILVHFISGEAYTMAKMMFG